MPSKDPVRRRATAKAFRIRRKQDPIRLAASKKYDHDWWLAHRKQVQYNVAKSHAKRRGLEFTISFGEIVWPEFCPVLGVKLEHSMNRKVMDNSPSMDRIDVTKGYVTGNVLVISQRANRIKNDATIDELQSIARFYYGFKK